MPTLSLRPVRRATAPTCADYSDLEAVTRYEREVRVHRARTEAFEIEVPPAIDGTWLVASEAGGRRKVDLVDRSGRHDGCDCPDFVSNELGTCKHLEAVRRAIAERPQLARAYAGLPYSATHPTITVSTDGGVQLRALGRLTDARLSAVGLERTSRGLVPLDPSGIVPASRGHRVRVTHAAVVVAERLVAARRREARTKKLHDDIERGRVGLDVLREALFPYQREGVEHLASRGRALLADDMGLGKTVQAIAACELLRRRGEASRVLIVTPASLKDQWAREIARYTGERAVVIGGGGEARRRAFESDAPYRIVNYELTWRELERIQALDADVLVLDEAQRAKNFRTKTAVTLRKLPSRFLFVLTGTPIENRLDDLYSLLQLVDPAVLGPLWRFNHTFHVQEKNGRVSGSKNLGELRARVAPVVLRRRKEAVLAQLPALTEQTRYTPLTTLQHELENEHRAEAAKLMKQAERRPLRPEEQKRLMGHLVKARQACNAVELCDPAKGKGSPKLDELEQLVGEIVEQGTAKVIVFSEWVEMLGLAAERLDKLGVGYEVLHGSVPSDARPELLRRFREDPSARVLLSSDAGGVGLNLQAASYVIHLDLPWNPGKLDQRTARAHRLGQTRGVSVTYLCAEGGIERGIEGTLAAKRALRGAALDASSDVDGVEATGFNVFLARLREAIERLDAPPSGAGEAEAVEHVEVTLDAAAMAATSEPASVSDVGEGGRPSHVEVVAGPSSSTRGRNEARARERARFARVVLGAGFPADAVQASYDALAASIAAVAEHEGPIAHAALVARLYRDLVPRGIVPAEVAATLARLRDLTMLRDEGVDVDATLAGASVDEAESWLGRLAGAPSDGSGAAQSA